MSDPHSILLIATRQIGDVLLATPLLRTLRLAYPNAVIDVLVYRNKGSMLEGNPDCNRVIEVSEHPSFDEYRKFLPSLFLRYDLAVNTLAGDRPHLYALWAARRRIGIIAKGGAFWKRLFNKKWVQLDNEATHTVVQNLQLAEALGLKIDMEVVPPTSANAVVQLSQLLPFDVRTEKYAVLHPFPMWRYKRWTEVGWGALITHLLHRFEHVVLTGGSNLDEQAFIKRLAGDDSGHVHSLAGKASFAFSSELLKSAQLYVGPDTAMTHLAAACGVPTIAIYGPSNPVKWGPWPKGWKNSNLWQRLGRPYQKQSNVFLLQGVQPENRQPCVPCAAEGCHRHKESESDCLQLLAVDSVINACELMPTETKI